MRASRDRPARNAVPHRTGSAAPRRAGGPARFIPPMAARLVDRLPDGEEWVHEVKFDG
jgi:bifunctional non-homologous end joining protein LigD